MTSTAGDHSLCLTVPSAQNTAPVLDFSCLYTHDIRRKAKRWQDGVIRFHTFNKRVMVYDVSRNFVGDTHWREPNSLQDGDDLELDKGVLIQVGESRGRTDQDLSSLFKKRSNPGAASPERTLPVQPASVATGNSTSVPLSQLRPRTLNSVLGIPKTSLGRAAIPLKSPFQLRLRKENMCDPSAEARAAKRQRMETPAERATIPVPVSSVRSAASTVSPSRRKNSIRDGSRTVEKTSTKRLDSVLPQKPTVPLEKSPAKSNRKEALIRDDPAEKTNSHGLNSPLIGGQSTSKSSISRGGKQAAPSDRDESGAQEKPQDISIELVNQLQIVARKPRKKLIHQNNITLRATSSTKLSEDRHATRTNKNPEYLERPEVDPQIIFHRAQQDRIEARLKRIEEKEKIQSHETGGSDSPHLIDPADDAIPLPPKLDSVKEKPSDILQSLISFDEQQGRKLAPYTPFTKSRISSPTDPRSPIQDELARIDQILLQNTKKSHAKNSLIARPSQPRNRPTLPQRSEESKLPVPAVHPITETDPDPDSLFSPSPIRQSRPPSPRNRSLSPPKGRRKHGPRSPLRKTISEPAALRRHSAPEQPPTLPVLAQDQKPDPWSREAWDLFGYERPKKKEGEG
ncbi:hypothetical protein MMC29_006828 [Sticta canariensis]|nr:hypothetical protein [Sticta canariensis]